MAKKAFDLLPPYPQPKQYHHHENKSKKDKKKAVKNFYFLVFGLFFLFVIYALIKVGDLGGISSQNVPTVIKPNTNQTTNTAPDFNLFDNNGSSSLTGNSDIIKVRIYNGATDTTNAATVKDTLLKAGYQIEKSDIAASPSDKTIIYYKKGAISQAQKVADNLKGKVNTNLEESSNLESVYDILVLVGKN